MSRAKMTLAVVFLVFSAVRVAAQESDPPNIVFIMADDLGYGHVGVYGQEKIDTPNIDRLASQGMRFTQAYSENICAPSRSVLMTGMHNGNARIRSNGPGMFLYPTDVTIPEVLKQAGYTTGMFGKWGLGDDGTTGVPWQQGFDEFVGQLHQVHAHFYYPAWIWKNDKKYPLFENHNVQHERYVADVMHDHAKDFIRTNQSGPFFAYLPYLQPHSEYQVPEEFREPYVDEFPKVPYDDGREGYNDPEHGYATYAGMISHLDYQVGEIMTLLDDLDIADNTILIFTSDNGPQGGGSADRLLEFFDGNGSLRGTKGDVYEGGIRVPFIARWPGQIEAGSVSDLPIYFPDMMPTFAQAAGTSAPENIDGISFLPELLGEEDQRRHEYMYWADYGSGADQDGIPRKHALRSGDWKAVAFEGEALELYNLVEDVGESNNVASEHPDVVEQMEGYFERALNPRHDFEGVPQSGIEDFVW
jgi:arylsulfatase A-like enzyme